MIIVNTLPVCIVLIDVTLAGRSLLPEIHRALLQSGKLEDKDDGLTLLPGDVLELNADTVFWIEG